MDTFIIVVQLLTPFAVLWLGWYYNRQQKKAQESKDAEQKLEALKRELSFKHFRKGICSASAESCSYPHPLQEAKCCCCFLRRKSFSRGCPS